MQEYFEGIEYPASKEDVTAAEDNGAPEEDFIGMIGTLSRPEFSGREEPLTELRAQPGAG